MGSKRILCFGDSLTWGWIPVPEGQATSRYPLDERWTGIVSSALGNEFEIIEEGLSSRTTDVDDPWDTRLNGSKYLPSALASHLPLDLVVLMLGTNDTKIYFNRSPYEIALGMQRLVTQVLSSAGGVGTSYPSPKVLIVSPPTLGNIEQSWFGDMFSGGRDKSAYLSSQYATVAKVMGVDFFDAGSVITTDGIDGIHFTAENNRVLGVALAKKIQQIFG